MRFTLLIPILTLVTCQPEDFDPFTECLVPDLNLACTNRCETISLECFANCAADDTACWSECLRENSACFNDCPCELNCLDGCDDCENPVCDCQVVQENPDWNRCIDDNSLKLGRCVHACNDNQDCEDDCLNRFKTRQLNCPCEENCSAGCPCSDFDCAATTPVPDVTTVTAPATTTSSTRNAVLVLSSFHNTNKPMIVDFNGNINEDLTFEYDDGTQTHMGCAATFENEFWYFGGANNRKTSKIVGCKLERQTDLTFDFHRGACNTFNQPNQIVLLCFDLDNTQECHTFDGKVFQSAGSSSFSHQYTYGMANYRGKALTTGCWDESRCYIKTELMDMNTLTWSSGPDYPFTSQQVIAYSTASTSEAAYIIGGQNTKAIIAEFKNDGWRQFGTLKQGRHYHGSITLGDETMVVGGYGSDSSDVKTEVWNFRNENHKAIDPALPSGNYNFGVGLYIVPFDYCTF